MLFYFYAGLSDALRVSALWSYNGLPLLQIKQSHCWCQAPSALTGMSEPRVTWLSSLNRSAPLGQWSQFICVNIRLRKNGHLLATQHKVQNPQPSLGGTKTIWKALQTNVLARYLAWDWQPFVFTNFKARFDGWYFTSFMKSLLLLVWLALY